ELRHALVRDHGAVALVAHRHRYGHEAPLALLGEVLVLEDGRDAQERGAEPADEFGLGPLPAVAPALAADGLVTPFEQAHEPARQAVLGPGVVHAAPDVEIAAALELLQPAPGEAEGEPGAAARVRAPLAQQVAAVAEAADADVGLLEGVDLVGRVQKQLALLLVALGRNRGLDGALKAGERELELGFVVQVLDLGEPERLG